MCKKGFADVLLTAVQWHTLPSHLVVASCRLIVVPSLPNQQPSKCANLKPKSQRFITSYDVVTEETYFELI